MRNTILKATLMAAMVGASAAARNPRFLKQAFGRAEGWAGAACPPLLSFPRSPPL